VSVWGEQEKHTESGAKGGRREVGEGLFVVGIPARVGKPATRRERKERGPVVPTVRTQKPKGQGGEEAPSQSLKRDHLKKRRQGCQNRGKV